jgi:hypothetical protein
VLEHHSQKLVLAKQQASSPKETLPPSRNVLVQWYQVQETILSMMDDGPSALTFCNRLFAHPEKFYPPSPRRTPQGSFDTSNDSESWGVPEIAE